MQKIQRLREIENIIREEKISAQEELLRRLRGKGMKCTQATLSRNLRQLGVARVPDGSGNYRYVLPESLMNLPVTPAKIDLVPVIREIIEAKGMMVIRTMPGNASNTALHIDGAGRYEIAGTIAGDDTILLIPRDGIGLQQVHDCLEIILPGIHKQIKK